MDRDTRADDATDGLARLSDLVARGLLPLEVALDLCQPRSLEEAARLQRRLRAAVGDPDLSVDGMLAPTVADLSADEAGYPVLRNLETTTRYELKRLLGKGGVGAVWLAKDRVLEREVAIKVLQDESDDQLARFVYEARVTGRLDHPGVVGVHDAGLLPDGRLYYAMPLATGRSLGAVVEGLRRDDPEMVRAFPLQRLLRIFIQVCQAMAFAHDRGLIHRDLKPDNVLLGESARCTSRTGASRGSTPKRATGPPSRAPP